MSQNKMYGWIGLARKAGKLVAGDALCEEAIARKRARLVIIADDCSKNTRERFEGLSTKNDIPCISFGSKEEIGHQLGRDSYAVAVVLSRPFAEQMRKCLNLTNSNRNKSHGGGIVE